MNNLLNLTLFIGCFFLIYNLKTTKAYSIKISHLSQFLYGIYLNDKQFLLQNQRHIDYFS